MAVTARKPVNGAWLPDEAREEILKWGLRIISLIGFLALWEWYGSKPETFAIAPPSEVFSTLLQLIVSGEILKPALGTFYTMVVGYVLAALVGIVIGVAIAVSTWARNTLEPLVNAAYSAPMSLLIPILGVYIGLGFRGRVFLVIVWAVFVIIINTAAGVREVPPSLIEMAQSFGFNRWRIYQKIIIPSAFPYILVGLRLGTARAIRGAVTAELLLSASNLGLFLIRAGSTFRMPELLAGIIFIVLIGLGLIQGSEYLEQRLRRWHHA